MLILVCFLKTRTLDDTPKRHETRNETQVTRQYLHNLISHLILAPLPIYLPSNFEMNKS